MNSPLTDPSLPKRLHHREEVMGTVVTFDVYNQNGISPEAFLPFLQEAVAVLHHADKVFSTWKANSPLSQLRRGEISLGEAPPEVTDVLDLCALAKGQTNGWFDPWALPGGVDPTGFVKGWSTQLSLAHLVDAPITGAIINAAGDIASFGGLDESTPFRVGITDPLAPPTLSCAMELKGAVATSGIYERGKHLVNPFTREAGTRAASASVTGPDLGTCDAWATALAVGGGEVLELIERTNGYEALAISTDGSREWTTGFPMIELEPSH
ncbi:MAG: FAD:protein FMN transferase [Acidimicrobiales bacterium]